MPAELPAYSGFTYALEFSADAAPDARHVVFSQPLVSLTPNFLEFETGLSLPVGSYARDRGEWIAEEDGRVVEVASVTAGLADLIVDPSGAVADSADYAALGITEDERRAIAMLFPELFPEPGATLWRARIPHFTDPLGRGPAWGLGIALSPRVRRVESLGAHRWPSSRPSSRPPST